MGRRALREELIAGAITVPGSLSIRLASNVRRILHRRRSRVARSGAVDDLAAVRLAGSVENRAMSRHPRRRPPKNERRELSLPVARDGGAAFSIIGKDRGRCSSLARDRSRASASLCARASRSTAPRALAVHFGASARMAASRTSAYVVLARGARQGRAAPRRSPRGRSVRAPRRRARAAATTGSCRRATRRPRPPPGWRRPPPPQTATRCTASSGSPSASTTAACAWSSLRRAKKLHGPRAHLGRRVTLREQRTPGPTATAIDSAACSASRAQLGVAAVSIPSVNGANAGFPSRASSASANARARSWWCSAAASAARRKSRSRDTSACARSLARVARGREPRDDDLLNVEGTVGDRQRFARGFGTAGSRGRNAASTALSRSAGSAERTPSAMAEGAVSRSPSRPSARARLAAASMSLPWASVSSVPGGVSWPRARPARTRPPRARRCPPRSSARAARARRRSSCRARARARWPRAPASRACPWRSSLSKKRRGLFVAEPRHAPSRGHVTADRPATSRRRPSGQEQGLEASARARGRAAPRKRPSPARAAAARPARWRTRRARGPRALVLDERQEVDRDALLRLLVVDQRVEQRLDRARADRRERRRARPRFVSASPWRTCWISGNAMAAVQLDQEPPVDRSCCGLPMATGSRSCSSDSSVPLAQVDLHRLARRLRHQLLVRRGAHHAAEQAIGLVGSRLATGAARRARNTPGKSLSFLAMAARNSAIARSSSCFFAVHLAELAVPLGVVGRQLDGARRKRDGVVVAIELGRVLRHALVELARPLGIDLGELLEDLDRAGQVLLEHEHPLEREERLGVARRERRDACAASPRLRGACAGGSRPRRAGGPASSREGAPRSAVLKRRDLLLELMRAGRTA